MPRRRLLRQVCSVMLLASLLAIASWPAFGQVSPRDYAIANVGYSFNEDENTFFLEVTVSNNGGDAVAPTTIQVISLDPSRDNEVLAEQEMAALAADGQLPITIEFDMTDFDPGSVQQCLYGVVSAVAFLVLQMWVAYGLGARMPEVRSRPIRSHREGSDGICVWALGIYLEKCIHGKVCKSLQIY